MGISRIQAKAAFAAVLLLGGCATLPEQPRRVEIPADIIDERERFTVLFCNILQQRGSALPDNRPCNEAISPLAPDARVTIPHIDLAASRHNLVAALVPGIGYSCFARWLHPNHEARDNLRRSGFDLFNMDVDALSGTSRNAVLIRDAILAMPEMAGSQRLVLIGYSKGAPDILEAMVSFPEIHPRVAAVVSIAGAIGGSPIADRSSQRMADLLAHFPGARCDVGDSEAVASLRPDVRRSWLVTHQLPADVRYYSVVTLPGRERISRILRSSYEELSRVDPLNDSQVIYSDQFIPGSKLLSFVNADHWAVVLPIHRAHAVVGELLVSKNDFPREALLEAIMRFVDEDLPQ
ncbi:MAG: hypothetical protein RL030_369 [Pseudomonadota bacterium]|jgi:hypothetical protein